MGFWLLVFFLTPIIEMYLLIEVGGYIGTLPTIALVMLTAVVGVALLRRQGLATLTRGRERLESGELPAREVAEGILLGVAGALLITPGFVTDTLGFTLLFPPTRKLVANWMLARMVVVGQASFGADAAGPGSGVRQNGRFHPDGDVIEGEFESRTDPLERIRREEASRRRGPDDDDPA